MEKMVKFLDRESLEVLPEPLNDDVGWGVAIIDRIFFQVLHVDLVLAVNDDVQFMRIENGQQLRRYYLINPVFEII